MAQKFYWSADFSRRLKIHRFGIEFTTNGRNTPKQLILALITSLASSGYVFIGNCKLEEIKNERPQSGS